MQWVTVWGVKSWVLKVSVASLFSSFSVLWRSVFSRVEYCNQNIAGGVEWSGIRTLECRYRTEDHLCTAPEQQHPLQRDFLSKLPPFVVLVLPARSVGCSAPFALLHQRLAVVDYDIPILSEQLQGPREQRKRRRVASRELQEQLPHVDDVFPQQRRLDIPILAAAAAIVARQLWLGVQQRPHLGRQDLPQLLHFRDAVGELVASDDEAAQDLKTEQRDVHHFGRARGHGGLPEQAVPDLDVAHVHPSEDPEDLGGNALQIGLGADQAAGG